MLPLELQRGSAHVAGINFIIAIKSEKLIAYGIKQFLMIPPGKSLRPMLPWNRQSPVNTAFLSPSAMA